MRTGQMRGRRRGAVVGSGIATAVAIFLATVFPAAGRAQGAYKAPRTADGKPDLNGVWQALNTANWDIQDHAARSGPVAALGAALSIPAGQGVVEGNDIPYQPWAAKKKQENGENWLKLDPEVKCYMPGVPRATYMPFPFQIVQTPAKGPIALQHYDGPVQFANIFIKELE